MIALDTDTAIAAINDQRGVARQRLTAALAAGTVVGLSSIVLFELWYGIEKSERVEANKAALRTFLTLDLTEWPFDADDAAEAGDIRADLEKIGRPIGPYDVLIAAQARRRSATLVTNNLREFLRVKGLRAVSWAKR